MKWTKENFRLHGRNVIIPYAVERPFWRFLHAARHPYFTYYEMRKWYGRPMIGDKVEDCRNEIHTVVDFRGSRDDLLFEDGHGASWMNCCDWPPSDKPRTWLDDLEQASLRIMKTKFGVKDG